MIPQDKLDSLVEEHTKLREQVYDQKLMSDRRVYGKISKRFKELEEILTAHKEYLEVEKNIKPIECDKCGSPMEIKIGRFGRFLACTNYPDCKNIKSLKEVANGNGNSEPEYTGDICPKCGNKTIYRYGKFGKFIGCSNYPDCDFTKQIDIGMKCPKCGGALNQVKRKKKKKGV